MLFSLADNRYPSIVGAGNNGCILHYIENNKTKVGKLTRAQLEEIATTKEPDLTGADLDARVRTIAGSARSMGLEVEL